MTILRPPSRPTSTFSRGENWFLWAVGGVVILLVVVMVVVKSFMGNPKEVKPHESKADPPKEAVVIGPGLRYEVLVPAQADKGKKETGKSEPVKVEPVKTDSGKTEPSKSESAKVEPAKPDNRKPESGKKKP